MKKVAPLFLGIVSVSVIVIVMALVGSANAAPFPTGVGGLGTDITPASGTIPIGNGSGSYTPNYLLCSGNCTITNASGSVTISVPSSTTSTVTIFPVSVATSTFSIVGDGNIISVTNPSTSTIKVTASVSSILALLSGTSPIQYNSSTGAFSCPTCYLTSNPSGYATTTIQSVLNSLSAQGLATFNTSTGIFSVSSSSLSLGSASHYNSTDFLSSSTLYVSSFNTRTGSVTLSSGDVTTALGFTPYNASNPNGFATTTIQSVLNSLSASGCLTYSTSTGQFGSTCIATTTGNWQGTWQNATSGTYYPYSNPLGFVTSTGLPSYSVTCVTGCTVSTTTTSAALTVTGGGSGSSTNVFGVSPIVVSALVNGNQTTSFNTSTPLTLGGAYTFNAGAFNASGTALVPPATYSVCVASIGCDFPSGNIQGAMNAASSSGGGTINVSAGTYTITATTTFPASNIHILGQGNATVVQFNGSSTPYAFANNGDGGSQPIHYNDELGNMEIVSTAVGQGTCLLLDKFNEGYFHDITCLNANGGAYANGNQTFQNNLQRWTVDPVGTSNFGFSFNGAANDNSLTNDVVNPDASGTTTGVVINGTKGTWINNFWIETPSNVTSTTGIGIDIQTGSDNTSIINSWLEKNNTDIQIAAGDKATSIIGDQIEPPATNLINDLGSVGTFIQSDVNNGDELAYGGDNAKFELGTTTAQPANGFNLFMVGSSTKEGIDIMGAGSAEVQSSIQLESNNTNRGGGIFMYDSTSSKKWYIGTCYSNDDSFCINRQTSSNQTSTSAANPVGSNVTNFLKINNAGDFNIATGTLTVASATYIGGALNVTSTATFQSTTTLPSVAANSFLATDANHNIVATSTPAGGSSTLVYGTEPILVSGLSNGSQTTSFDATFPMTISGLYTFTGGVSSTATTTLGNVVNLGSVLGNCQGSTDALSTNSNGKIVCNTGITGSGIASYEVTSANSFISVATTTTSAALTFSSSSLNLGSASTHPSTDFLSSSTAYVATTTGNWQGTVQGETLGTISTFASTDYLTSSTVVNTPSSTIYGAGSYLGTSGSNLTVSSTLASSSVAFLFYNATTSAPYNLQNIQTSNKKNVATVSCFEYAAATSTIELYYNTTLASSGIQQVILSSLTCGNAGTSTTSFTTSTIPAGAYLWADVTGIAGSPTLTTINVEAQSL